LIDEMLWPEIERIGVKERLEISGTRFSERGSTEILDSTKQAFA
jgi:hypothetical protein